MRYARKKLAIIKEREKNITNLATRFLIFSAFQGIARNCFCLPESPSIQYSILRKTISIKIVCGQAHPQNIRPNTTVNKMIKTTNVSMAIPKIKKSCGQNTMPNIINLRSSTLSINSGSLFTLINGSVKKTIR